MTVCIFGRSKLSQVYGNFVLDVFNGALFGLVVFFRCVILLSGRLFLLKWIETENRNKKNACKMKSRMFCSLFLEKQCFTLLTSLKTHVPNLYRKDNKISIVIEGGRKSSD